MRYYGALGKISWGYVFIYLSVNLGTVNILPAWAGFLLIYAALNAVAELEPSAGLLKPFALLLAAADLVEWVMNIFGGVIDLYWINVIVGVISLYFHFQLLTNLAQIAEAQGSSCVVRLRKLRSVQTIFMTVIGLVTVGKNMSVSLSENGIFLFSFAVVNLIVMLFICISLFAYRKDLRLMEEQEAEDTGTMQDDWSIKDREKA